jgi:glycosyltransferase involved in cell wall biosynthesis
MRYLVFDLADNLPAAGGCQSRNSAVLSGAAQQTKESCKMTLPAAPLTFDVVIATRNRPEALALSIPLLLAQSRLPEQLIVIDSSDDHAPVAQTVAKAVAEAGFAGPVIVKHSEKGLTRQRNVGLLSVTADVVIFPDDDSLMFPGTTAAMMAAYERDPEKRIAGVCTAESPVPPPGVLPESTYAMTSAQKREQRFAHLRNRIERRFEELNPFMYMGRQLMERVPPIPWLAEDDCVLVEWMTGFRMSFRTDYIRQVGFEASFTGYSRSEDVDACFGVSKFGCFVGARQAKIYHHKFPARRDTGFAMGATAVTSRAYVVAKHVVGCGFTPAQTAKAKAKLRAYARFKLLNSALRAYNRFDRDQLRGAWTALGRIDMLMDAPVAELPRRYAELRAGLGLS